MIAHLESRTSVAWQPCILAYLPTHSLTRPRTHSLTHALTHSFTHLFTRSVTHSLTHVLADSFKWLRHLLTNSLTQVVESRGAHCWPVVATFLPGRKGKQCRERCAHSDAPRACPSERAVCAYDLTSYTSVCVALQGLVLQRVHSTTESA